MSTLTKVLIILLTVSSIFLCGIVATYVAQADNYKKLYDSGQAKVRSAQNDARQANDQFNKLKETTQQEKAALQAKIGVIESEMITLKNDLRTLEVEKNQAINAMENANSLSKGLQETTDNLQTLFQNKETELVKVASELTKERNQNKEVTAAILEKMAIIAQLEEQLNQLQKEKENLQAKLVQVVRQYGKTMAKPTPSVPTVNDNVEVASPPTPSKSATVAKTRDIGLKGLITQVDLKNSLAMISVGAADGVKDDMRFYVTRGDAFICELLILDVDAERAVGFLERVQSPPKSGDNVSTNIGAK
ncbi:MAG: hypothetical protein JW720_01840 [Sedimentisphaerales bacterium]|nr:hypothetical protein [Sedimentisphaerales bacterium]